MKLRPVLFMLLFVWAFYHPCAQSQDRGGWGDAAAAQQYVKWARQAIDEERWDEALAALERAADFANVSSDISYLLAVTRSHEGKIRISVLEALDRAIEINRWADYNADHALLLKAEQLIAMRSYSSTLAVLDQVKENTFPVSADLTMLRLLAFRGLAADPDNVQALARFRSQLLLAMDRYPRDPRPLRIFFEYARNRRPQPLELAESDIDLLELALRRLPFLLEADPDLAWMAAPLMRNTDEARRLTSSYRAGGLSGGGNENFRPSSGSIAVALNLGLIDDTAAVEELFAGFAANGEQVLDKDIITEIDSLLRSDDGRDLFTQKLLSFSGIVSSDEDHSGYASSLAFYSSGFIREINFDMNRDGIVDLHISFTADGVPVSARYRITGEPIPAHIQWERYPSVEMVTLAGETFLFRPADFQFAPVSFIELGGGKIHSGLVYPVPSYRNMQLTRRSLVSFCASISRPSVEFTGAVEQIFLERGIPMQAVETINGKQVSFTEFERGAPVIQRLDLDLDGRMETVRRFRRPGPDFNETFDLRGLAASSESDWGDGRYKTGEMYLQDGSVVYSWDMDGSGTMNYSETETGRE